MAKKQKHRPSFFKLMLGDFAHHLQIPPAFLKHFNKVLPKQVILEVSTGKLWVVKLKKIENGLFLEEGWGGFMEDNSIEFGNVLVFRLLDDSKFYVKIYDNSGCRKKKTVNKGECAAPEKENVTQVCQKVFERPGPRSALTLPEKQAYEQAVRSKSPFPFFIIKLCPSYLRKGLLSIPTSFVRTYLPKQSKSAVILGLDGRTWSVGYNWTCKGYLSGGWSAFVSGNNLKEGYVCAFELIDDHDDIKLKFSVLSA